VLSVVKPVASRAAAPSSTFVDSGYNHIVRVFNS
jgi:hypothetical protein